MSCGEANNRPVRTRTRARTSLVALAGAFVLGGCAILPNALTDEERVAQARLDMTAAFAGQQALTRPLTLDDAFARALAYNLDQRAKLMEEAVARSDVDLANIDLLPKVLANAGYTDRNNVEASSSTSVLTGRQSLEPSTSSDQIRRFADLTLSWNVLDFGVSYFAARQQADRTLIVEEQRRRVVHQIFQDVRRSFWRAAAAQLLASEVRSTIAASEAALESGRKLESEGLRSPADALRYQKAMLDLLRQLEPIERQLAASKIELAALINLPPGTKFSLAIPRRMAVERLQVPVSQMEEIALLRNPDLREASYQTRISADETRKAFVRMLPGISINYGRNWDSNSFLVNNYWAIGAARLSWNVVNLIYAPYQINRGKSFEALADLKRQALSVTVLARLHIAYQQYIAASREYRWAAQLADVDRRLYQQIANRTATDAQGELEKVSAQVSAVFSDVRRYQAYADMQAALGRLYATIGLDPLPGRNDVLDLASLSQSVRAAMAEADKEGLLRTSKSDPVPESKPEQSAAATEPRATTGAAPAGQAPKLAHADPRSHIPE